MKESKKTMLVIAVTLLLAAALFVGAAGAADAEANGDAESNDADIPLDNAANGETGAATESAVSSLPNGEETKFTYWQKVVTEKPSGYAYNGTDHIVTITLAEGLAYFGNQVIAGTYKDVENLTVNIEANLDMGAHYWIPLTSKGVTYYVESGVQKAAMGDQVLLKKVTFDGKNHAISNLKVNTTMVYKGATDLGANNNYCAGFVGYTHIPMEFKNLTFKDENVTPDFTYGLPDETDPKGYNQVGGIVGHAAGTIDKLTFDKVVVDGGQVNGSSKVAPFIGATDTNVKVEFKGCEVKGTIVTGFDSLAGLVGYAGQAPVVDLSTSVDAEITTAEFTQDTVPKEMLGSVYAYNDAAEPKTASAEKLWTDPGDLETAKIIVPKNPVLGIIKGDYDNSKKEFTGVKIRDTKADLYNLYQSTPTKYKVTLYDVTDQEIDLLSKAVNAFEAAVGTDAAGYVCYPTLQEAVNAAQDNNTVIITKDITFTDTEVIGIGKKLTIKGEDGKTITLSKTRVAVGTQGSYPIFNVDADVTIENLKFAYLGVEKEDCSIWIKPSHTVTVKGCTFDETGGTLNAAGIISVSDNSKPVNVTVDTCTFTNLKYGMYLNSCNNVTVTNSTFTGTKYNAINIANVAASGEITISDNEMKNVCSQYFDAVYSSAISIGAESLGTSSTITIEDNTITLANEKAQKVYILGKKESAGAPDGDGKVAPDAEVEIPGVTKKVTINEVSDLPTTGEHTITKVEYAASAVTYENSSVKGVVSIDVTVYTGAATADDVYHDDLGSDATVKFTIPANAVTCDLNKLAVYHKKESGDWEKLSFVEEYPKKVDDTIEIAVKTRSFSPFAVVEQLPEKKSSSSQGTSTWANEPAQQTEPTATPTAQPTVTEVPSVVPIETPAPATPAPFIGILAGLGAAAAVFGLRRK